MQIRSVYFCIETCIGENINWKSYNRIIKLSTSYIIVKYIRGGLALERFLPRGVEGADILFPRWKQTHVSKSAGNESGDIEARKEFWMRRHSANFLPLSFFFFSGSFSILGKMRFWTLQKLDCWIALLTQRVRFFVFRGKCGILRVRSWKKTCRDDKSKKKSITLYATPNTSGVKTNRDLFEAAVAQVNNKVASFLKERSTASSLLTVEGEDVFFFFSRKQLIKNCSVEE